MSDDNKSFNKMNQALRNDVGLLWDECFGDLNIVQQRLLKAHGMLYSKSAYVHREIPKRKIEAPKGDRIFDADAPQTKMAQKITDKIIKKMINGDTAVSGYLKHFLEDKKVKVAVGKALAYDAGFCGYDPSKKEIHLLLTAGCFNSSQKCSHLINEDHLAATIGHELGHAVEIDYRSSKCSPSATGYSSNSREVESFCDAFGCALAASAGYSLEPTKDAEKFWMSKNIPYNENNPHPPAEKRYNIKNLIQKVYQPDDVGISFYDDSVVNINWDARNLQNDRLKKCERGLNS